MEHGMSADYYERAFVRNLGIVSGEEQARLRESRVAIAGLGGLGGINFVTLVRMGIGGFNISDLDEFSIANINRQMGATSKTAGLQKVDVMASLARDIHPEVEIQAFPDGVHAGNIERFLTGADAVVDSIDFFALEPRKLLYRTARQLGKTVVFAAPIGFSGTLHVFSPRGMSFDEYFDIRDDMSPYDQLVAFAVGLVPRGTHWGYMDTRKVDLASHSGPSISSACNIASGLLTTEVLAIILGRRSPAAAPHYVQFDPYRRIYRTGYLRWGNRGLLQRLKRWVVARRFRDQAEAINGP